MIASLMNDSFNTVSTLHACNGCVQAGRTLIHSISARDAFSLLKCTAKAAPSLPRLLSQGGPRSGLCLQGRLPRPITASNTAKPRQDHQRQTTTTTTTPKPKPKPLPKQRADRLALCRPPQRVSPCKPFPNPFP